MKKNFIIRGWGLLIAITLASTSFSAVLRTTSEGVPVTDQTVDNTFSSALSTGTPAFTSGDVLTLDADATRGGAISLGGTPYHLTITSDTDTNRTITLGTGNTGAFFTDVQGSTFSLNHVTFDGNASFSGFQTTSHDSGSISIHTNSATFQNLQKDYGGAVYARTTTLTGDSLFSGNQTTGSGGAIYNYDGMTQIRGNHTFLNNRANNRGGAVYNQMGEVSVAGNVLFQGNSASYRGVAIDASWDGGLGNIYLGEDTSVSRIVFRENIAGKQGSTVYALRSVRIQGTDTSVVFQENQSRKGNGGAIAANESMTISNGSSEFTGNSAWDDDGANSGWGGALYTLGTVTLSGNRSLFTDNSATKSGGAIEADSGISITRGTHEFRNNTAGLYGGAISTYQSSSLVSFSGADTSVTFSGNRASGTPNDIDSHNGVAVTIQDSGNYFFGGGIVSSSLNISKGAHVTLGAGSQNSVGTLTFTHADLKIHLGKATDAGLETKWEGNFSGPGTSAIRFIVEEAFPGTQRAMTSSSVMPFIQRPIVTLAAGQSGLAYATKTADNLGWDIAVQSEEAGKSVYRQSGNTFISGTDLVSVGAPGNVETVWITGNVDAGNGSFTFTERNVTYQSNTEDVRTIQLGTSRLFNAGNITLNLANLHIQGKEIIANTNGGLLHNGGENKKPVVFYGDNVTISDIRSQGEGGVFFIYGDESNLTLYGTNTFDSNEAMAQSGGVISVARGSFTMYGTNVFRNNKALYAGGAIYARDDILIQGNNLFENNESTENYGGGAIRSNEGDITISGVNIFTGNKTTGAGSDEHGGAILLGDATKTLTLSGSSIFQNNRAAKNGGAIYSAGNLVLEGDGSSAWFSENYDQNGTSDIYVENTTTIRGNGSYYFGTGTRTNTYLITEGAKVTYGANSGSFSNGVTISNNAQLLFAATPVENGFGAFFNLKSAPTVESNGVLAAKIHGFTVLSQKAYTLLNQWSDSLEYSETLFDKSNTNGTMLTLKEATGWGGELGIVGFNRLLGVDSELSTTAVENYQLWVDTPYTDMFVDWLGMVTGLETTGENGLVQIDLGTSLTLNNAAAFVWDFSAFEDAYGYTATLLQAGVNNSHAVPEPSTLLLLFAGILILWRKKK